MIVFGLAIFGVLAAMGLRDVRMAATFYIWQALFRPHEFVFGWRDGMFAGPPWSMGAMAVLFISWFVHARQTPPRMTKITLFVVLDVMVLELAGFLGENPPANHEAMKLIGLKLATFFVFTFIAADPGRLQHFASSIGVTLGLTGAVGFVNQFAFDAYARFDGHEIVGPGGDISDRNDYAMYLAFGAAILVPLALAQKGWKRRFFFLGLAGASCIVCVVTGSRGGFIGLAMCMAYALSRLHHKRWFVVMALVAALGVAAQLPASFYERILGVRSAAAEDPSAMGRLCAWKAASNMARLHTFGIGPGAWASRVEQYMVYGCHPAHAPHSHIYGMLGEAGKPGAVVWSCLMAYAYYLLWQAERRLNRAGMRKTDFWYCIIGLRCAYLPYAISGAFLSCQYHEVFFMLMCCCGCAPIAVEMAVKRRMLELRQLHEAEHAAVQPLLPEPTHPMMRR